VDVGFEYSINPYQGCEHGCIYCYARNTHEYWGYSMGQDFERKVLYKANGADLLRAAFNKKSWVPKMIMLSGNTDCYQPAERKLKLTRELLVVCLEYKHPVGIITKNALLLRDFRSAWGLEWTEPDSRNIVNHNAWWNIAKKLRASNFNSKTTPKSPRNSFRKRDSSKCKFSTHHSRLEQPWNCRHSQSGRRKRSTKRGLHHGAFERTD